MRSAARSPIRALAPLAAVLAVAAGCVPAPPPPPRAVEPRPVSVPVAALPPAAPPGWQDRALSPGDWHYERDARGSRALFGTTGGDARVVLRCDRGAARVYLSVAGAAGALTVRTSSATRTLALQPTGAAPPYAAVALAPGDPLLDAMAFSRGRIALEPAGSTTLTLPAWSEIGRVVQDCRG